jgi:hypothetical protein
MFNPTLGTAPGLDVLGETGPIELRAQSDLDREARIETRRSPVDLVALPMGETAKVAPDSVSPGRPAFRWR